MAKSFSVGLFCHGCQGKGIITWESYDSIPVECMLVFRLSKRIIINEEPGSVFTES